MEEREKEALAFTLCSRQSKAKRTFNGCLIKFTNDADDEEFLSIRMSVRAFTLEEATLSIRISVRAFTLGKATLKNRTAIFLSVVMP